MRFGVWCAAGFRVNRYGIMTLRHTERPHTMTSHLPPSLTRTNSHTPGGTQAERQYDILNHRNTDLTEQLRHPRTPFGKLAEWLRRIG